MAPLTDEVCLITMAIEKMSFDAWLVGASATFSNATHYYKWLWQTVAVNGQHHTQSLQELFNDECRSPNNTSAFADICIR